MKNIFLQSQADVLFLKHDTKLADEKITILLDKLQRLDVKLGRVRSHEKAEENKQRRLRPKRGRETQEFEEEGEEEEEERFSSRDASRPRRSRRRRSELVRINRITCCPLKVASALSFSFS